MLYNELIKPELISKPNNAQIIQCKILSWPRVLYSKKHQIKFIWKTPLIGLIDILISSEKNKKVNSN